MIGQIAWGFTAYLYHCLPKFFLDERYGVLNTGSTSGSHRTDEGATEQSEISTTCDRSGNVESTADAAVDNERQPVANGFTDRW